MQSELGIPKGVTAIRDFDEHHVRRTIWDRGLNGKGELPIKAMMKWWSSHSLACQDFLPRISRLSDLFIQKLREYNGQPVVINDWCHYITFDVMGDVAFSRSYGQLDAGRIHPGIAMINQWLSYAVLILQVPWLTRVVQHIPVEDPEETLRKFAAASLREREQVSATFHRESSIGGLTMISFVLRKSPSIQTSCRISSEPKVRKASGCSTRQL